MMKRERMREKRPYGILAAGAAVLIACRLIPAVPWYAASAAGLIGAGLAVWDAVCAVRRMLAGWNLTDYQAAPVCRRALSLLAGTGVCTVLLLGAVLLTVLPAGRTVNGFFRLLSAALDLSVWAAAALDLLLRRIFSGSLLCLNDGRTDAARAKRRKTVRNTLLLTAAVLAVTLVLGVLVDRIVLRPQGEPFADAEAMQAFLADAEQEGYASSILSVDAERHTVYLREEMLSVRARRASSREFFAAAMLMEMAYAFWRGRKLLREDKKPGGRS